MAVKICKYPFEHVEINKLGEVYSCCAQYQNEDCFGNIFKQSFDDIWNGYKAMRFREKLLRKDYSLCDFDTCSGIDEIHDIELEEATVLAEYPKFISIGIDNTCSKRCVMCRDKVQKLSEEETEELVSMIDTTFIPMLKNAELVSLNSEGELFESDFCKKLMKKAAEVYPDIKFEIVTNGTLCNKTMLEELNITDKILRVSLSLNAMTEDTYEKIVRRDLKNKEESKKDNEFNEIFKNINYLVSLREKNLLNALSLTFCLTPINFRELPDFVKLLIKLKIPGEIICCQNWGDDINFCKNFEKNNILNPNHKNHKKLIKILQQKEFFSPYIQMNQTIRNIQEELEL